MPASNECHDTSYGAFNTEININLHAAREAQQDGGKWRHKRSLNSLIPLAPMMITDINRVMAGDRNEPRWCKNKLLLSSS
jgi:hypothetical protein